MYDNYNERGLGRMTLGLCFGIGSFATFLKEDLTSIEFALLFVTFVVSLIVYYSGHVANNKSHH